jgi:hypothetical protein
MVLPAALTIAIRPPGVRATTVTGWGKLNINEAILADLAHDLVAAQDWPGGNGTTRRNEPTNRASGRFLPLQLRATLPIHAGDDLRDFDCPRMFAESTFQKPAFVAHGMHTPYAASIPSRTAAARREPSKVLIV